MVKKILKKLIPRKIQLLLIEIHFFFKRVFYTVIYRGSKYYCSFCGNSYSKFLSAGLRSNVLKERKVIGGGYRHNVLCPFCFSGDRARLIHLFLKEM